MDLYQLLKQDHQKAKRLFEQLSDTSDRAVKSRERLFAQLKQELELHTEVEEQHFYPALREQEETKDLIEEALEEHNEVNELLQELDGPDKDDESWLEQLSELQENVEHHVEEEETQLFPRAQKVLKKVQADEIAAAIEKEKEAALKSR
jgi:iron-sulfur cluster repair protein YtfE (RIC family)